jgi:hypothetical protein
MAANESIITQAIGNAIGDTVKEREAMLDTRFYLAIVATLVALLLIAVSKLH